MAEATSWVPPDHFDEFRLLRPLGRGAMGQVYLGHDTQLDRPVAIKFLAALDPDPTARERFLIEARAIARLSHPNVVGIHRVGEVVGRPYLVSEYVRGQGLDQGDRPLPWQRALEVGLDLARGLSAAHRQGVVHRDIKPANVIVTEDGAAKLLDFGLAKLLEVAPLPAPEGPGAGMEATLPFPGQPAPSPSSSPALTAQGALLGTPLYLAPELWRGGAATPASDVYALGALLYELCSGQAPHRGDTLEELRHSAQEREAAPLSGIDDRLAAVVTRCLHRDPAQRFASGEELRRALEAVAQRRRARRWPPLVAGTMALILVAGAGWQALRGRGPALDSLAVLPFANAGGDPDGDYLSDGMTEGLINDLSQLSRLKVIARASVFRYKGKADAMAAGRELGVRAVLTGRVLRRGDGLSVSAELMDVGDDRQLWGQRYERRRTDVAAVQQEIAQAIAGRLRTSGEERGRLGRRYTDNAEAYDLYLNGKHACQRVSRESIERGLRYLERAVQKDPGFAPAYSEMASCESYLESLGSQPTQVLPRAWAAIQRALELDDGLAEAHAGLAYLMQDYRWDFPGAEREFRRALALKPGRAETHHSYSHYLIHMGRFAESLIESRRALELDPLDPVMTQHMGFHFRSARQYDESIAWYRKAIAMDPNNYSMHLHMATSYEFSGRYPEAIAAYQKALALGEGNRMPLTDLTRVFARAGRREEALRTLREVMELARQQYVSPVELAAIHLALGDREQTFAYLEQALREHAPRAVSLGHDITFDEVRQDPRYQDLLRRIGLPP